MINFTNILMEIGEGNSSAYKYNIKLDNGKIVKYTFTTSSNLLYLVELKKIQNAVAVDFQIDAEVSDNMYHETNKGDMYKIMSTIIKIVTDYLKNNPDIEYIRYEPKQKETKTSTDSNQRDKLYRAYLKKYIPDVTIFQQGGTTFAKIK